MCARHMKTVVVVVIHEFLAHSSDKRKHVYVCVTCVCICVCVCLLKWFLYWLFERASANDNIISVSRTVQCYNIIRMVNIATYSDKKCIIYNFKIKEEKTILR